MLQAKKTHDLIQYVDSIELFKACMLWRLFLLYFKLSNVTWSLKGFESKVEANITRYKTRTEWTWKSSAMKKKPTVL